MEELSQSAYSKINKSSEANYSFLKFLDQNEEYDDTEEMGTELEQQLLHEIHKNQILETHVAQLKDRV